MKSMIRAFGPAMLLALVCGCGQSGPLYLPGNPSEVQQPPAAAGDDEDELADER